MKTLNAPLLSIVLLLAVLAAVGGTKWLQMRAAASGGGQFAAPPSAVNVFTAELQAWPNTLHAVGSVHADEGITVLAEVPGRVESIHFRSGDFVEKGTLLLTQHSGNESAQLAAAKAQWLLAQSNFNRVSSLRDQKTVSESDFEVARQELASAEAEVRNLESTLDKKTLRARFSGRLGIRKVDLGQDLQIGDEIVALQSHDNLRVNFTMPQRYVRLIKSGLPVEVNMIEDKDTKVIGQVNAVGAEVDMLTRNIEVQATLEASEGTLIPGMAVEVYVQLPEAKERLVVPSTAVVYAPYGDTVFVIEMNEESGQLQARQQFVKVLERRGDFVAIGAGLQAGEQVASAGAFKLYNGQNVMITENPETAYSLNPTPSDS